MYNGYLFLSNKLTIKHLQKVNWDMRKYLDILNNYTGHL